jgi:hypothetical protein
MVHGASLTTTGDAVATKIYEARPFEARAETVMNISVQATATLPTTTLTRYDGGSFLDEGFIVGMQVTISGVAGRFTIAAVDAERLVLANAALTPTLTGLGSAPKFLTVVGYDARRAAVGVLDATIQVGGDHIVVCSTSAYDDRGVLVPCGSVVGGRTPRSSSTATPRRTASGTPACRAACWATTSGPSPSIRSPTCLPTRRRTTPGSSRWRSRSSARATT